MPKDPTRGVFKKLTDIDLSDLVIGERLTIYRGSNSFLTGPGAVGYAGDATVLKVGKRSALLQLKDDDSASVRHYKLRFKDGRIVRIPNGETTMLYAHARGGRPTRTAYFTDAEYQLVKNLLGELGQEIASSGRAQRLARSALERMWFHDRLSTTTTESTQ